MDTFTLFLILFPLVFGLLMLMKWRTDRIYGTPDQRAADLYGWEPPAPAPQPAPRQRQPAPAVEHAALLPSPQPVYVAPVPRTPAAPAAPAVRILSPYRFLEALTTDRHVLLVGPSRSGKTTIANALTSQRSRTDRLVIFDPHYHPANWCGLPALRKAGEMDQGMVRLLVEFEQRKDQMAVGDESYAPITVFMDESPVLKDECPTYKRFIGKMLREALKYKIRLVVLTQSKQVRTMGIEGESDVLRNLVWVLLGEFAASVAGVDQIARPVALERAGQQIAVNTNGLLELGAMQARHDCLWSVSTISPPTHPPAAANESPDVDAELAFCLGGTASDTQAGAVTLRPQNQGTSSGNQPGNQQPGNQGTTSGDDQEPAQPIGNPSNVERAAIEKWLTDGMSANAIAAELGGKRSTRLAQIRAVKESIQPTNEKTADSRLVHESEAGDVDP